MCDLLLLLFSEWKKKPNKKKHKDFFPFASSLLNFCVVRCQFLCMKLLFFIFLCNKLKRSIPFLFYIKRA